MRYSLCVFHVLLGLLPCHIEVMAFIVFLHLFVPFWFIFVFVFSTLGLFVVSVSVSCLGV